jgi:hypothetical protein
MPGTVLDVLDLEAFEISATAREDIPRDLLTEDPDTIAPVFGFIDPVPDANITIGSGCGGCGCDCGCVNPPPNH